MLDTCNHTKLQTNISLFHKLSSTMILESQSDTKLSAYIMILTPVCNLRKQASAKVSVRNEIEKDNLFGRTSIWNKQTQTNVLYPGKSAKKKYHSTQSWSLCRQIMGMLRVNVVCCDTKESESANKSASSNTAVKSDTKDVKVLPIVSRKKYMSIKEEVDDYIQNETPIERLQRNLKKDEITYQRGDSVRIMEWSISTIMVMLSVYGFYTGGTEGSKGFVKRNRLTMYVDAKALHRRLSNTIVLEGFKQAIKLNKKFLGFLIPAFAVERFLTIYTNKTSALYFGAAFGVAGAINRFMLGPKGMFAGGIIAGTLGLINGIVMSLALHKMGLDQESMNRQAVYEIIERERSYRRPESVPNIEEDDYFDELD